MKTPPSQMSGLAWKEVPSVEAVDAQKRGGARSHPGIVYSGWGLSTLRLLWDISRGWTLHQGCSRRQIRRCLNTLSCRVAYGSPGNTRAISGRGTGLNPWLESMSTVCVNHGWRLECVVGERRTCDREEAYNRREPKWGGHTGTALACATGLKENERGGGGVVLFMLLVGN